MGTTLDNYFLIDKIIINTRNNFLFNLYGSNSTEGTLILVYDAGKNLSQEDLQNLFSFQNLYVHNEKKHLYDDYYKSYIEHKIIPENMENFYKDVSQNMDNFFENPESTENMKEVKIVVSTMVDTILKDDFKITTFISVLAYDYYTHTHSLNVSIYALCLGKHIGLEKDVLEQLGTSALLHDLGKTQIDQNIINKNGTLTEREFKEVQKHPYYGWLLAKKLGITHKGILCGIRNHHEKIDGSGYPDGLVNNDIHLFAKIISICDVFDALTTRRNYKDSVSTFDTLILMKKEMTNHLDGKIINHFIQILRDE